MVSPAGEAVRGWLLLLCVLLAGWQPLTLALYASRLLPGLVYGDSTQALGLVARVAATGLGVAAALVLWRGHTFGVTLAKAFLILSTLLGVLTSTSVLPSNLAPSDRWPALGLLVAHHTAWYVYLARSKRVRRTYGLD